MAASNSASTAIIKGLLKQSSIRRELIEAIARAVSEFLIERGYLAEGAGGLDSEAIAADIEAHFFKVT